MSRSNNTQHKARIVGDEHPLYWPYFVRHWSETCWNSNYGEINISGTESKNAKLN